MPSGVQLHAGGIVSYSSSILRCVKCLVGFSSMQGE